MAAIVQCNAIPRSSNLANEITINMSRIGALQLPQNDKSFASLKTVALTSTLKLIMFAETRVRRIIEKLKTVHVHAMTQNTTISRASDHEINRHLWLQSFAKGSQREKSDAFLKFQMLPPWGLIVIVESELARFMDPRGFTLESISSIEVKLPFAITINASSSTNTLLKKNLRKASSLRSPRKSWKTSSLMHERMHFMVPDSFQNSRLCLPEGWPVSPDCKIN